VDHRLLLALTLEREGNSREARLELERLLLAEPEHVLGNHFLGNLCFHEGVLLEAIRHYERALAGAPRALRIGLCHDFQLVDHLPPRVGDEPVDLVQTPRERVLTGARALAPEEVLS